MNNRIDDLEKSLNILVEDKSTLEQKIEEKNNQVDNLQQAFELQKEELNKLMEETVLKKLRLVITTKKCCKGFKN